MTSKVIIRVGDKTEKVEADDFFLRGCYRFAKDLSVAFVQHGIYYIIITEPDLIDRLYDATADAEASNNYTEAHSIVKEVIVDYVTNRFDDFNLRIEKAIKTAHGIGVKKSEYQHPRKPRVY